MDRKTSTREVEKLINEEIGPWLDEEHDHTSVIVVGSDEDVKIPKDIGVDKKNIWVVRRLVENKKTGYDTIYLVSKNNDGKFKCKKLLDSEETNLFLNIEKAVIEKDKVVIQVHSGVKRGAEEYEYKFSIPFSELK